MAKNSPENVFRFSTLRGPIAETNEDGESEISPYAEVPIEGDAELGAVLSTALSMEPVQGEKTPSKVHGTTSELQSAKDERDALRGLAPRLLRRAHAARTTVIDDAFLVSLPKDIRGVLNSSSFSVTDRPVRDVIADLQEMSSAASRQYSTMISASRSLAEPSFFPEKSHIIPAGVMELNVVKQRLIGYAAMDIAHIENILKGESKSRKHRNLERVETSTTRESEVTKESSSELSTADRFEMNEEVQKTIQRDRNFGFGLTVSGKYGPTVEFESNVSGSISSSETKSSNTSVTYAQDVVERSLERINERVRTEQVKRVLLEQEEINKHGFNNEGGDGHVRGIYQFLEKVYRSQVFNYGLREVFDLMIPEPASYLWAVESDSSDVILPEPPKAFSEIVRSPDDIDELTYEEFAAEIGATDLEPPPPLLVSDIKAMSTTHIDKGEGSQPRKIESTEINVPEGYTPHEAEITIAASSDQKPSLFFNIGTDRRRWLKVEKSGLFSEEFSGSDFMFYATAGIVLSGETLVGGLLPIQVYTYETRNYAIQVKVHFERSDHLMKRWQIDTYSRLKDAHEVLMQRYEDRIDQIKRDIEAANARAEREFGDSPTRIQQIIREELKKHCISILTGYRYDMGGVVDPANPTNFNFNAAYMMGRFVRFFEQAFEWDQIQYVLYPYFWSRKDTWRDRTIRDDTDPQFSEFMRSVYARVVISVRPGFEAAVSHYMETKSIWNGTGEPDVNSDLYLPIVDEIRERTGGDKGETPVGLPWETRMPTPLVLVRENDQLPRWKLRENEDWVFDEVEEAEVDPQDV